MSFYDDNNYDGVETSVVDQYGAPNVSDDLHSDIPETKAEENSAVNEAQDFMDDILEGDAIEQYQAQNSAEALTDAAVADGATAPHPAETVGEELEAAKKGYKTSVVNKYAAPEIGDDLHSDIPVSKGEANKAVVEAEAYAADILEGDALNQFQAQNSGEALTDAAVADGATVPHPAKTVGEELE